MWIPATAIIYAMFFTGGYGIAKANVNDLGPIITVRPEHAELIESRRFRINANGQYGHPKKLVIRGGIPEFLKPKKAVQPK